MTVKELLRILRGQDRARANARAAATAMSRNRVEREGVALFLEELESGRASERRVADGLRHAHRGAPR